MLQVESSVGGNSIDITFDAPTDATGWAAAWIAVNSGLGFNQVLDVNQLAPDVLRCTTATPNVPTDAWQINTFPADAAAPPDNGTLI